MGFYVKISIVDNGSRPSDRLFSIYGDLDSYTVPIVTSVPKSEIDDITNPYIILVPDGTTSIRIIDGVAGCYTDKLVTSDDPCEGVTCPIGQECVNGICQDIDPCEGVTCPIGQECVNGICQDIDPCEGVTCPIGQECVNGICQDIDPCEGVTCPPGEVCVSGICEPEQAEILIWLDMDDTDSFVIKSEGFSLGADFAGGSSVCSNCPTSDPTYLDCTTTPRFNLQTGNGPNYCNFMTESFIDSINNKGTLGGQFNIENLVPYTNSVNYSEISLDSINKGIRSQLDGNNNPAYLSYQVNSDILNEPLTFIITITSGTEDDKYFSTLKNSNNSKMEFYNIKPGSVLSLLGGATSPITFDYDVLSNDFGTTTTVALTYDGIDTIEQIGSQGTNTAVLGEFTIGNTLLNILNNGSDGIIDEGLIHEVRVYSGKLSATEITDIRNEMQNKYI